MVSCNFIHSKRLYFLHVRLLCCIYMYCVAIKRIYCHCHCHYSLLSLSLLLVFYHYYYYHYHYYHKIIATVLRFGELTHSTWASQPRWESPTQTDNRNIPMMGSRGHLELEMSSASLAICEGIHQSSVNLFPKQPVLRGFHFLFDVSLNKLLKELSCCGWSETRWRLRRQLSRKRCRMMRPPVTNREHTKDKQNLGATSGTGLHWSNHIDLISKPKKRGFIYSLNICQTRSLLLATILILWIHWRCHPQRGKAM